MKKISRRASVLFLLSAIFLPASGQAAPGDLDTTYGSGGIATADFGNGASSATGVAVQSDDKLVAAGVSEGRIALARYSPDGSLDTTFSGDGRALGPEIEVNFGAPTTEVAITSNGKIVVAARAQLVRFNADGSLDLTFGEGGSISVPIKRDNELVRALALQSDGKIVLLGDDGGNAQILRRNADGSPDSTFSGDGAADISTNGNVPILLGLNTTSDGKVVAVGFLLTSSFDTAVLIRLNTDGTPDSSFSSDGYQTYDPGNNTANLETSIVALADGSILTGGSNGIHRFSASGTLDTTFAGDGLAEVDGQIRVLAVDPSGGIFAAGSTGRSTPKPAIRRFTSAGQPDTAFSGDGVQSFDFDSGGTEASGLAFAAGSKVVAVGPSPSSPAATFGVARLTADGANDAAFAGDGVQSTSFPGLFSASVVAVQPDGKLIVIGSNSSDTASATLAVARFNADGSLDTTFSDDGLVRHNIQYVDSAYDVAIQPDGKIVIAAGNRDDFAATVIRLNADGSLDSDFGTAGHKTFTDKYRASGVALQPDGKILFSAGPFLSVVRLEANGDVDTGFGTGGTASYKGSFVEPFGVALSSGGRIAVSNGSVAVFTTDGTLDTTFSEDGTDSPLFGSPTDLAFQPDGKLVVGANYLGPEPDYIGLGALRYATNGTLDTTFSDDGQQISLADQGCCMRLGADGTVLLAGRSSSLVRLLPNGSFDSRFSGDGIALTSTVNTIRGLALTGGGKGIITVGSKTLSDRSVFAVARYDGGPLLAPDQQAPTITFTTPTEGQHFAKGADVAAVFSCNDGSGSGIATCSGPAKVDTTSAGSHTLKVTATDNAGSAANNEVTYVVDVPTTPAETATATPSQTAIATTTATPTPSSGPTPNPPAGPTAAQIAATLKQHISPSGKSAETRTLAKRGFYSLAFVAPVPGAATVKWSAKGSTFASGRATFIKAGNGIIKIKITKAGKRTLKKAKRLQVAGSVTFTPANGQTVTVMKTFVLKR